MAKQDEDKPLIRGHQVLANFKALELLDEKVREQIRALLPAEVIQQIQGDRAWVPIELDMELCEAVQKVVGDQGLWQFSVDCVRVAAGQSVLSSLLTGAAKLFGINPGMFISFGHTAWGSVFRHFGDFKITIRGEHEGLIEVVGLPEMAFDHLSYFVSLGGNFQGVVELSGRKGKIVQHEVTRRARLVSYTATWD